MVNFVLEHEGLLDGLDLLECQTLLLLNLVDDVLNRLKDLIDYIDIFVFSVHVSHNLELLFKLYNFGSKVSEGSLFFLS